MLSVVVLNMHGSMPVIYVKLDGLDETKEYRDTESQKVYSGAALMSCGLPVTLHLGDYQAYQIQFEATV